MDININYFHMTFRCQPPSYQNFGLILLERNLYKSIKDNAVYIERPLYNLGWGNEIGYERQPCLGFSELIQLLLTTPQDYELPMNEAESNRYGAAAVIMEQHVDELVRFLAQNVNEECFLTNNVIKNNLRIFCFDTEYYQTQGGDSKLRRYEDIFKSNPQWKGISEKVIKFVYGH